MAEFAGVFHVHSTFSDGTMSVDEIHDWAIEGGLDFVCITDHSEHLTQRRRANLIDECARLSDDVLLVPGTEFAHSGRHVIVLGPRECLLTLSDADAVRSPETVRERGGMTIWAHPSITYALSLREGVSTHYDGWEVWNVKADGAFPNLGLLSLIERSAQERNIVPMAGWDLHTPGPPAMGPRLVVSSEADQLSVTRLIQSLSAGVFRIESEGVSTIEPHSLSVQCSALEAVWHHLRHRFTRATCAMTYLAHRAKKQLLAQTIANASSIP